MGAENSAGDYATAADEGNFATKEAMGRMGRMREMGVMGVMNPVFSFFLLLL